VAHLIPLQQKLAGRLAELGRQEWVREEFDAVAALEPARRGRDVEGWQRIKGVRRLSRRQQAVLKALFAWRESVADRTDVPAFKIVSTETMIALAEKQPKTADELRAVKGLSPRMRNDAPVILEAIAHAAALPEDDLPRMAVTPRPVVSDATRKRIEALRTWRAAESARLALDVSVVLPQRLLERVAEVAPREAAELDAVEGLRRWRREVFGDALIRACAQPGG
jgi:ribonuclease D